MSNWYYKQAGQILGPIPSSALKELAAAGQLLPEDSVRRADMEKWTTARKVQGLFAPASKQVANPSAEVPPVAAQVNSDRVNSVPKRGRKFILAIAAMAVVASVYGVLRASFFHRNQQSATAQTVSDLPKQTPTPIPIPDSEQQSSGTTSVTPALAESDEPPISAPTKIDLVQRLRKVTRNMIGETFLANPTKEQQAEQKETWEKIQPETEKRSSRFDVLIKSGLGLAQAKAEMGRELDEERSNYWRLYPSKPRFDDARDRLCALLWDKDVMYLISFEQPSQSVGGFGLAHVEPELGNGASETEQSNPLMRGLVGGEIDSGIWAGTHNQFITWAKAFYGQLDHSSNAKNPFQALAERNSPAMVNRCLRAVRNEYDDYAFARDWAEFNLAGQMPLGFEDPEIYAGALFMRYEHLRPEAAAARYREMTAKFGEKSMLTATKTVYAAPKDKNGNVQQLEKLGLFAYQESSSGKTPPAPKLLISVPNAKPLWAVIALAKKNSEHGGAPLKSQELISLEKAVYRAWVPSDDYENEFQAWRVCGSLDPNTEVIYANYGVDDISGGLVRRFYWSRKAPSGLDDLLKRLRPTHPLFRIQSARDSAPERLSD